MVMGGNLTPILIKHLGYIGTWQKNLLTLEINARWICLNFSSQIRKLHCWVGVKTGERAMPWSLQSSWPASIAHTLMNLPFCFLLITMQCNTICCGARCWIWALLGQQYRKMGKGECCVIVLLKLGHLPEMSSFKIWCLKQWKSRGSPEHLG